MASTRTPCSIIKTTMTQQITAALRSQNQSTLITLLEVLTVGTWIKQRRAITTTKAAPRHRCHGLHTTHTFLVMRQRHRSPSISSPSLSNAPTQAACLKTSSTMPTMCTGAILDVAAMVRLIFPQGRWSAQDRILQGLPLRALSTGLTPGATQGPIRPLTEPSTCPATAAVRATAVPAQALRRRIQRRLRAQTARGYLLRCEVVRLNPAPLA